MLPPRNTPTPNGLPTQFFMKSIHSPSSTPMATASGDIPGITLKLDYIKDLGCNAIWLNPCFDSPFKDAGYDVRDYKKVASRYGTNDDLIALFDAAHRRDMHVNPRSRARPHQRGTRVVPPQLQGRAKQLFRPLHLDRLMDLRWRRTAIHRRRIAPQRYLHLELLQMPAGAQLRFRAPRT